MNNQKENAYSVRVEFVARDHAEAEGIRDQIQSLLIHEIRWMRVDAPAIVCAPVEPGDVGG